MLRRILILFLFLVLTGFGLTAAYALLNFRGPEDALNEAQEHANRGNYAAVVELLDLCERGSGMRDNPEFLDRLLRLRFDALRRLNNRIRAVEDLDRLLEGREDQRLEMDRVYYLIGIDEGQRARKLCIELLERYPKHVRGYELAGEACKSLYTEPLQEISAQLRGELEHGQTEAGIDAFLEYIYRPEGDPDLPQALRNLEEIYGHEPRFVQAWPKLADRLAQLRAQVQEATGYFRTSLELAGDRRMGGWLAAAFRGVSFAMQQADRDDDLIAQCVIYLTRYDHRFTVEAATAAARLFMEQGQHRNAIAIAKVFLPEQSLAARLEGRKITGSSLQDLLVISSISMYRLGMQKGLSEEAERIARMAEVMTAYNQEMPLLTYALASGLAAVLNKNQPVSEEDERHLLSVFFHYRARPAPLRGEDPVALLAPL
ncbi:MAG: hypothetical protein VYE77_10930, partial [Planctomycetota bacterium]|nr:hypothetical protein [Planctomycetota bacterium]